MQKKDRKIWKYVVKNIPKTYGETDFGRKVVAVNKQYHKSKSNQPPQVRKNKDGSANLLDTIVHEAVVHKNHPNLHEKTVRKLTPKLIKRMSKKRKQKLYNKFK